MMREEFFTELAKETNVLQHLIRQATDLDLTWRPRADMMSLGQVIHHLSEGMAEFMPCLVTGQFPIGPETPLPTLEQMKSIASCPEAVNSLDRDLQAMKKFLDSVSEQDFLNREVTVPWGDQGKFWRIAYSFIEHLKMHKMQLFLYLRLKGKPLNTMDLYAGGQ